MPDDPQLPEIVTDPRIPDGVIAFVDRDPAGQPRVLGRVLVGPAGAEPFDLSQFTDLGYTTDDGLVYGREPQEQSRSFARGGIVASTTFRDETRRDATERDETRRDILEQIDAAVQERCACGCGAEITDASPSAYYATQTCQSRWMNQQATDPREVYERPDAAMYVGDDSADWPLTGPASDRLPVRRDRRLFGEWVDVPQLDQEEPPELRLVAEPIADVDRAYLRHCGACGERVQPQVYEENAAIRAFGVRRPIRAYTMLYHACSRCDGPLPGPVYWPTVTEQPGPFGRPGWLLELRNEVGRTKHWLSRREFLAVGEPRALVDAIWRQLERDLARFTAGWEGRQARAHALYLEGQRISAACMDPTNLFRVTGA